MTLTLLFDLDDTLLINPMESFLPAYLKALSEHLVDFAEPNRLIKTLMAATQKMSQNTHPECTLKDTFDSTFYPALGLSSEDLRPALDEFYAEVFPKLKNLTRPQDGAAECVNQALERGYRVAIATNPLFPLTAILQRIAWAGLPTEQYPFEVIPSFETFHFAKPNPAYLAEVLARMGWPDDPVIMVGDNLTNDILAARRLGLPAYWLSQNGGVPQNGPDSPTASGELSGLLSWLDSTPEEDLKPNFDIPSAILAILRATPAALDSICNRLDPPKWTKRPEPSEWCQTEILCHLRDVEEEVNLPRIQKVLSETNPFLPGKDTDPWAEERKYVCQNGQNALQRFTTARLKLLARLENLSPQDWQRPARHAIFGPTQLKELVSIIAEHDRLHIQQVYRTQQSLTYLS